MDDRRYTEIIVTRVTVPVGEDIGFLPGTEEEKMGPWMGALDDNLEVLSKTDSGAGEWGRAATNDLVRSKIKIKSLNFMRGRTFLNKFVIIDEAQNLTPKQMKTLITRAGPGHEDRLPRQPGADRHALPDRRQLGPDLRGRPLQGLAALRPRHAGARRALAPGRLRERSALGTTRRRRARPQRRRQRARLDQVADLLQRGRILDRRQVAGVAPLADRLDRAAQQLAGARLRQARDEVDARRPRDARRAASSTVFMMSPSSFRRAVARRPARAASLRDDEGHRDLALERIGDADDRDLGDVRMARDALLDLARAEAVAGDVDHVVGAAEDEVVAVVVADAPVEGVVDAGGPAMLVQ